MDHRMRDLDQLQEHDPEERGRRVGALIMAAAVTGALMLAIAQVIGESKGTSDAVEHDPLDQLDRVASVPMTTPEPKPGPGVDATKLTFERELTEHEDRPEVMAALAAAAREEQRLATDLNAATAAPTVRVNSTVVSGPADTNANADPGQSSRTVNPADTDDEDSQYLEQLEELRQERPARAMPAAVTASAASRKIARAASHDRLVADALPKPAASPRVRVGEEGEFTLQVISYDTQAAAQSFAAGLRAKGHEAFVASGNVNGRGRYYRVRVGPFATRGQAEEYRRAFEQAERMNTIVVKRVPTE